MTKKDFQAIARLIHEAYVRADPGWTRSQRALAENAGAIHAIRGLAGALSDVLAASSPRFNRERFIKACETR